MAGLLFRMFKVDRTEVRGTMQGEPMQLDAVCEHHEVHKMHDDVQPSFVVDSDAEYTGDYNMILYDQYMKDNTESVVQTNVSSVPNDAYMMIINEMPGTELPYEYLESAKQMQLIASLTR
ncbi:hypothetical protein Tco_0052729 [Tanacetum coccineum]